MMESFAVVDAADAADAVRHLNPAILVGRGFLIRPTSPECGIRINIYIAHTCQSGGVRENITTIARVC